MRNTTSRESKLSPAVLAAYGVASGDLLMPMDTAREACHAEQAPVRNQRGNWRTTFTCRGPLLDAVAPDTARSNTSPRPRQSSTSSATGTGARRPHRLSWDGWRDAPSAFVCPCRSIRTPAPDRGASAPATLPPILPVPMRFRRRIGAAPAIGTGAAELAAVSRARVFVRLVRGVRASAPVGGGATVATLSGHHSTAFIKVSRARSVSSLRSTAESDGLAAPRALFNIATYLALAR